MAEVLFQKGSVSEYNAGAKNVDTLYHVQESGVNKFYLGELDLSATKAEEISIADVGGKFESSTVEGALNELASQSEGGVASKTVYLRDESAGQSAYAKTYVLYQGADSSDMTQNVNLGSINIPKDKVLQDAKIVTVSGGVDSDGDTVPAGTVDGKYIKFIFQNVDTPVYLNVQDLIDIYTGGSTAEATIAVDSNNVITCTINKIAATKVIYQAADDSDPENPVPEISVKAKIDSMEGEISQISTDIDTKIATEIGKLDASVSIEDAAGTNPLNITVTEVDGKLTSVTGSIDADTFDAFGSAATAKTEVIGASTDASSANTIWGAKNYADDAVADAVADLDTAADVVIASKSGNTVTLKAGISETDGVIAQGSGSDIVLSDVASTGAAADVAIVDADGHTTETTVEGAIGEIYTRLTWGTIPAVTP